MRAALKVIMVISIAGILFSGYMSYVELKTAACGMEGYSQHGMGMPVCMYGLIMYLAVFITTVIGLRRVKNGA